MNTPNDSITPVEVPHGISERQRRARRSSWPFRRDGNGGKGWRIAGVVAAAGGLFVTLLVLTIGAVLFIANKADRSEVEELREAVHRVETDMAVIKQAVVGNQ